MDDRDIVERLQIGFGAAVGVLDRLGANRTGS
jgi:hypothetical protein